MIERHPILIALLMISMVILGSCIGTHVGATLLVPVRVYQLETGETIHTWLDEELGVACVRVVNMSGGGCVGLRDTVYGRQIGN
jgi:hypothetical protein